MIIEWIGCTVSYMIIEWIGCTVSYMIIEWIGCTVSYMIIEWIGCTVSYMIIEWIGYTVSYMIIEWIGCTVSYMIIEWIGCTVSYMIIEWIGCTVSYMIIEWIGCTVSWNVVWRLPLNKLLVFVPNILINSLGLPGQSDIVMVVSHHLLHLKTIRQHSYLSPHSLLSPRHCSRAWSLEGCHYRSLGGQCHSTIGDHRCVMQRCVSV